MSTTVLARPKGAIPLKINHLIGYVPQSWNDLPREKVMKIVSIILLSRQEPLDADELIVYLRVNILAVLMDTDLDLLLAEFDITMGEFFGAEEDEEVLEIVADISKLLDLITFCFEAPDEDAPEKLQVKMGLTRCPYPQLTNTQGVTYYAPADELENISIYELATVLTLMDAYTKTKDADTLHKLLATVYREGKRATDANLATDFDGDRRQGLYRADHLVNARARHWKKVPHIVKQTLWFWLASCRQAIVDNPAFGILFEQSKGGKEDPFGWAGTLLHIADGKVMNMDQAANSPYASALLQLAREKHMAMEEEIARKRNK